MGFISHNLPADPEDCYIVEDDRSRRFEYTTRAGYQGAAVLFLERLVGVRFGEGNVREISFSSTSHLEPAPHLLCAYGRSSFAVWRACDAHIGPVPLPSAEGRGPLAEKEVTPR